MKLFEQKPESPGNHQILIDIMNSFLLMLIARAILEVSFLITGEYICAGHVQLFVKVKIKLQLSFPSRVN